jgi:hypothetical protein
LYERSPDNLTVDLGRSRALIVVLAVVHGGAAVLASVSPMPMPIRVAVLALLGVSLYNTLCVHALRCARAAVAAIAVDEEGGCALRWRNAEVWEDGRVVEKSVQRWLAVLVVRASGQRWPIGVVICADAVSPEAFRRLRLRLRLQTAAAPGSYPDSRSGDRKKDNPG